MINVLHFYNRSSTFVASYLLIQQKAILKYKVTYEEVKLQLAMYRLPRSFAFVVWV